MMSPLRRLHQLSSHNWICTWKTIIVLCITAGSDLRFLCRLLWTCLSCHQFRTPQHHLILAHRRISSDRVMRAPCPMLRLSRNLMASLSLLPYSSQPTFSRKWIKNLFTMTTSTINPRRPPYFHRKLSLTPCHQ
jgi:hypothetical protein